MIWISVSRSGYLYIFVKNIYIIVDISDMNIFELPVKIEHILNLETLPNHHKDPFDRILIAQSLSEPLKLLTHDKLLQKYSADLIEYV